ncbi:hypothetical protein Tco_0916261 [Tanacetum coccineum]
MREGRLRWFGHVKRGPHSAPVRRVKALLVDGLRIRGRPKLRWEYKLKQDMKELLLSKDMTSDMNMWRDRIRTSGSLAFAFALFLFSFLEQYHYAHVHWPEVPWKQSLYFQVYPRDMVYEL